LKWAREISGLDLEDAALRAKISNTKKATAIEKLSSWENGEDYPTQTQLAKLAKAYCRPLTIFFLDQPPVQSIPIADFRTVRDQDLETYSIELAKVIRATRARQEEVRELLLDDEDFERFEFTGAARKLKMAKDIAARIREDLGLTLATQFACKGDVFSVIRESAESKGIFIQLIGDLGSHHSKIEVEEFRGFVLADDVAPWIVLNPYDSKNAHAFTLVHELAHLWLGEEGISNASAFEANLQANKLERLCNQVAAEFLLPEAAFLRAWEKVKHADIREVVARLKADFCVSSTAVACRLWNLKQISDESWWELYKEYRAHWEAQKAKQKEGDGRPSYYIVKQHKLGKALVHLVGSAVDARELSMSRAGRILGINPLGLAQVREAAGG